jgi:hypothetical protein
MWVGATLFFYPTLARPSRIIRELCDPTYGVSHFTIHTFHFLAASQFDVMLSI